MANQPFWGFTNFQTSACKLEAMESDGLLRGLRNCGSSKAFQLFLFWSGFPSKMGVSFRGGPCGGHTSYRLVNHF